jgi:excisionase family DNA binding protein
VFNPRYSLTHPALDTTTPVCPLTAGLTVREVARRYRVSRQKVRAWIMRGELPAINTAAQCRRRRWVVTADGLAEFERRRSARPPPEPAPRRRRTVGQIDYYP